MFAECPNELFVPQQRAFAIRGRYRCKHATSRGKRCTLWRPRGSRSTRLRRSAAIRIFAFTYREASIEFRIDLNQSASTLRLISLPAIANAVWLVEEVFAVAKRLLRVLINRDCDRLDPSSGNLLRVRQRVLAAGGLYRSSSVCTHL